MTEPNQNTPFEEVKTKNFEIREAPSVRRTKWFAAHAGRDVVPSRRQKLGEWLATGICGNDITSSCLYVAAIATAYAGAFSPIVLLIVAGVLYLYRNIYAEVGDALPLNGGAYNCLLNTTTKFKASLAACMTLLSYMATACISARAAASYASSIGPALPELPITLGILIFFAGLTILGITESARVALAIFLFHMGTLALILVFGAYQIINNPEILQANWAMPTKFGLLGSLYLGFSAALLGISGFESSANFIEEQKDGVFPKTLRNMWIAVAVLNPLIALVALSVLPIAEIETAKYYLLAEVSDQMAGQWLRSLVAIDATLVLSGAVLTAFVGSTGLVGRMTLDRCLPQFLLFTNKRGTQHRIILLFFILCGSILILTGGDLFSLGGVYTISFLAVMCAFAIGNGLLKVRRSRLPRRFRASWIAIFVAFFATAAGLVGQWFIDPTYFRYFAAYFFPTLFLILLMLGRHHILRALLFIANDITRSIRRVNTAFNHWVQELLDDIKGQGVIFFTKGDDAAHLNQAMLYVKNNEITQHVTVIHVFEDRNDIPDNLESDLRKLDEIYPDIEIELVLRQAKFGPELIDQLSKEFNVPKNYMFIGAPSDRFPHRLEDLGGVRLII